MWGVTKRHPSNLWIVKRMLASTDDSNFEGKCTLLISRPITPVLCVTIVVAVAGAVVVRSSCAVVICGGRVCGRWRLNVEALKVDLGELNHVSAQLERSVSNDSK